MDIIDRLAPPVPRIPRAADPNRIPQPEQIAPWSKPGADVAAKMRDVYDQAWKLLDDLVESRPDGKTFRAVEDAAVRDGNPDPLVQLIEGEPQRYAAAVIACRRAVADMDAIRAAGQRSLESAAVKIKQHSKTLVGEFADHAKTAWNKRGTSAGLAALETCDTLLGQLRELAALHAWCSGIDKEFTAGPRPIPGMDRSTYGYYIAARLEHDNQRVLELPAGAIPPPDWEPTSGRAGGYGAANANDLVWTAPR